MEFNFDFLKKEGKALKDFANTDVEDEEERSTAESIKAAIEKEQEILEAEQKDKDIDDESSTIEQILKEAEEKKEEEKKEKGLDDKLADIEKVISTFGSQKSLGSTQDPFKGTKFELNKPIDFNTKVATNYIAPYLQQPTSQGDRIKLLFESLKKQNLI